MAVRNFGLHKGIADVYAWGLQDNQEGLGGIDLRGGGVQSIDPGVCDASARANDRCIVFAINLWGTFNSAAENEYDVVIDVDNDDQADVIIAVVDLGLVFGTLYGIPGSVVIDAVTGDLINVYFASASANGSTILAPALASDLGLRPGGDRNLEYWMEAYPLYDDDGLTFQFDLMTTGLNAANANPLSHFDAFDPVLSNGAFRTIRAGVTKRVPLVVDTSRYQAVARGHKGWMIVSLDDANGRFQADFVPVGANPS